jgi:hypothetical protein
VAIYRLHNTTGDDLGLIEHPAPYVEPGDVIMLNDGREALVTARVETDGGQFPREARAAWLRASKRRGSR